MPERKHNNPAAPRRARRNISFVDKTSAATDISPQPQKESSPDLRNTRRLPNISASVAQRPNINSTREFTRVTTIKRMGDTQQFRLPAGSVSRLRRDPGAVYMNTANYNRTLQFAPIYRNADAENRSVRLVNATGGNNFSSGRREGMSGETSAYIPIQQMTAGAAKYRTVNNNPVYSPGKKSSAPRKEEKVSALPLVLSIISAVLILTAAVIMAFRFFGNRENSGADAENITEAYTTAPTDTVILENEASSGNIEITEELTAVLAEDEPD
ncbi:MAG: hypothetical protein GX897_03660 [Clostridiales bacterium]|nr:hypothetical protein [Clostridiales bacterium]